AVHAGPRPGRGRRLLPGGRGGGPPRGPAAVRWRLMGGLRFDLERDAVRVVLTDEGGRVLLFHAVTPEVPAGWWELPGGGIHDGGSYPGAAVRAGRGGTRAVAGPGRGRPAVLAARHDLALARAAPPTARGGCGRARPRAPARHPRRRQDRVRAGDLRRRRLVGGRRDPRQRRAFLP